MSVVSTGDLMRHEVVCCTVGSTVEKVAKLMRFAKESYMPVVEGLQDRKVIGGVSDRDLVEKVLGEGKNPQETLVEDILSAENMLVCQRDTPVEFVLSQMDFHGATIIPVVDSDGRLEGVISFLDIALYFLALVPELNWSESDIDLADQASMELFMDL
ncbi:MAG: CBS domain-containing protein, partial [Cyanobacteria bacterium]|nr:CBS domain-containing protein [Cyanobacteriota bacterium]